jgi:hypothetical protein
MRLAGCLLVLLALIGISAAQSTDTNFPVGPQYLITTDSTLFLRPIATPSMSLQPSSPPPPAMETNPGTDVRLSAPAAAVMSEPDLSRVLWGNDWVDYVNGVPRASVIEISGNAAPRLPLSLFDPGVTGMTDAQFLREQGYGLTLGDVSAASKSRPRATHVYNNDDIRRLHGS